MQIYLVSLNFEIPYNRQRVIDFNLALRNIPPVKTEMSNDNCLDKTGVSFNNKFVDMLLA